MFAHFIRDNSYRVCVTTEYKSAPSIRQTTLTALVLAASLCQAGDVLGGIYDPSLGTLPEAQGWQFIGTSSPAPTVSQGVLHQGPTVFAAQQYWDRSVGITDFTVPGGVEIDLNLRVVTSTVGPGGDPTTWRTGFEVLMTDQFGRSVGLGIADSGFLVTNSSNGFFTDSTPFIPFDTTSAFRDYRLAISSTGILLSIDNVPAAALPLGSTNNQTDFWFGDGTFGGASETYLQSLAWGPAVPEPSGILLLALGASMLLVQRMWKRRSANCP